MKADKTIEIVITLEFNLEEAKLLRDMVQNPISEDETIQEDQFRESLFLCLNQAISKEPNA